MKLIEIANNINKSKENEDYINIEKIADELGILYQYDDFYEIENHKLKAYWIGNWHCTHSYVGYKMYFLHDKPVAYTVQKGRKCDEIFYWFSEDIAKKVREYITSLIPKKNEIDVNTIDINSDIGDSYKIEYNENILSFNKPMLNRESVIIIKRILEMPDYGIDKYLIIKLSNGKEETVHISDLDFKFYLKE